MVNITVIVEFGSLWVRVTDTQQNVLSFKWFKAIKFCRVEL